LRVVADTVILGTVHRFGEQINGANNNILDALSFLHKSFENLTGASDKFVWQSARDEFVENFSRLVNRSQMQVGHHTSRTYSEIESFVKSFVERETTLQTKVLVAQEEEPEEEVQE
jgi:CRISPR/Cas system CSM-associated protein Csm3 (group 7 of RAMP superfamily)